jgi:hypothetical protein
MPVANTPDEFAGRIKLGMEKLGKVVMHPFGSGGSAGYVETRSRGKMFEPIL